jgi:hypothetical protein
MSRGNFLVFQKGKILVNAAELLRYAYTSLLVKFTHTLLSTEVTTDHAGRARDCESRGRIPGFQGLTKTI